LESKTVITVIFF